MGLVVGIDGGATKTRGVLADSEGNVLAVKEDQACNFHHVGVETAVGTIARIVADLGNRAGLTDPVDMIACGLAGVGRQADHDMVMEEMRRRFGGEHVFLASDADIALVGGSLSDVGIIVIAGTGSIVYGRNADGATDRIGGYGSLLSDEGGGYAVAVSALKAMMQAYDGLETETGITDKVLDMLGKETIEDIVTWSLQPSTGKEEVARLGRAVLEVFEAGDPVARRLVVEHADFLATAVNVLHRRLGLDAAVPVTLSGGMFKHCDAYAGLITRKIRYLLPAAKIGPPRLPAVLGAVLFALNQIGADVDKYVIKRLGEGFAANGDRDGGGGQAE